MSDDLREQYPGEFERLSNTLEFIDNSIEMHRSNISKRPGFTEAHSAELSRSTVTKLLSTKDSPYFGRIDIETDGQTESIYIGETGIEDSKTLDRWVVSWQAPIASLFYEYTGAVSTLSYKSHQNQILRAIVQKKRSLEIKNSNLVNVFETAGVADASNPGDEHTVLASVLGKNSDGALQAITSTIQYEQNMVIRYDKDTPVIVQGVAGSGKTSIGVHRASYLLFNNDALKPENVLIIGPNKTFLKYIEGTLPKLQSQGINQHTFDSWIRSQLDFDFSMMPLHQLLANIRNNEENLANYKQVSKIKGSLEFMNAITTFFRDHELHSIPLVEMDFSPGQFISAKQIITMYAVHNSPYAANEKRERVLRTLGRWVEDVTSQANEAVNVDSNNSQWESAVLSEKLRTTIVEHDKRDTEGRIIKIRDLRERYRHIQKQWPVYNVVDTYVGFATDEKLLRRFLPFATEQEVQAVANRSKRAVEKGIWDPEDISPLLHIHSLINKPVQTYGHIIVDEAQDLTPFEFAMLINASRNNSITILGDMSQSIYSFRSIKNWSDLVTLFTRLKKVQPPVLELKRSYRSTKEIIKASNVLLDSHASIPIGRHGQVPQVTKVAAGNELFEQVLTKVRELSKKKYASIGIIGNTPKQCESTLKHLRQHGVGDIQMLLEPTQGIQHKVVVIPEYLVKGLEFDAVIILNAGENRFRSDEIAKHLLYILFTRARHELVVFYYQAITAHLKSLLMTGICLI